jgi:ribosomal-protein-alanine N-acetyltransferase
VHTVIINRLNIRPMALSDVVDITQIEQKAMPHPWRKSQFIDSYEKHHCLALTLDGHVIGYTIYNIVVDEAEILNIAIHPEHQNKGHGRYLLEHLITIVSENAQRFFLEVRVNNASAIYLYENIGFVEVCQRKNYYQTALTSEDALLMAMEL